MTLPRSSSLGMWGVKALVIPLVIGARGCRSAPPAGLTSQDLSFCPFLSLDSNDLKDSKSYTADLLFSEGQSRLDSESTHPAK